MKADVEGVLAGVHSGGERAGAQSGALLVPGDLRLDGGLACGIQVKMRPPVDSTVPMGGLDGDDTINLSLEFLQVVNTLFESR